LPEHITRKDLKKDEFRDTIVHGADAVMSHKTLTTIVVVVAVLIAAAIFGWKTYTEHQTVKAEAAFDDAKKVFLAPVAGSPTPPIPGETTYPTDQAKYTEAAQKFATVASTYPRTRPGQLAAYYAALSDEKINKNDDAKKWLQGLADGNVEDFAAMAKYELAQLNDRLGNSDEALKLYQQLMAKPAVLVPKPVVMLALAGHYAQKNPTEAAKLYTQIKTDYPDTPIAQQADQGLNLLPGKS
jgi:predicted negative regulator of RcsB-dependent stress response